MNGEMKSSTGNVVPTLKKMSAYTDTNAVHYRWESKTEEEKEQARVNIGAADAKTTKETFAAHEKSITEHEKALADHKKTLSEHGAEVAEHTELMEELEARMNILSSLPDGSTTGDAEVADIRVGYDGTVYKTAAEAVRGQARKLSEAVANVSDNALIQVNRLTKWRNGGLYTSGQIYTDQTANRIVSALISLRKGDVITCQEGIEISANYYSYYVSNDDFNMIDRRPLKNEPLVVSDDCVAFIGARKQDDGVFTADEILMAGNMIFLPDQRSSVTESILGGAEEAAYRLISDIPVDALGYYEKWTNEIPKSKYAYVRELLCYADDTEKYPVYLYRFDLYNNWVDNGYAYNNYNPDKENALYRKPRILVTSGIHGNERATPIAAMAFVKNMLENPAYAHLLGQYDWYFVPLVNPWGFSHSVIENSTGNVVYNNTPAWDNDTLPVGHSIIENTPTRCGGIRRNADSMDINRDFSDVQYVYNTNTYGFTTPEARAILSAAQKYKFDMVIDLHQSFDAASANNAPKCGYVRMQYAQRSGEPSADRVAFYRVASAVNSKVDNYFREMYGNGASKPMSLIWNGGTNPSIMNYFGGYEASDGTGNSANKDLACAYSCCVETSQVCYPISMYENGWYNAIANHYTSVYCAELMRNLSALIQ